MDNGESKRGFKVLVVEDHPLYRQAIADIMNEAPFVNLVEQSANGLEALAQLERQAYDLIFLDISMPQMNGVECMSRIHELYPNQKVIILTQYDSTGFYKKFEALGVCGYLLKSSTEPEIIEAISKVLFDGEQVITKGVQRQFLNIEETHEANLSGKELEVVHWLCHHLTTSQIAERMNLSSHTISSHRKHILSKIGATAPSQIIEWAMKNDIVSKQ